MAVGNRGARRRIGLLALAGAIYYFAYSAGRLDPFFNAHQCAAREFFSVEQGACAPCTHCYAGEEVLSPCHGTSDTKCRLCTAGSEYLLAGACVPCSACPMGELTQRPCAGTADTVCGRQAAAPAAADISGFHDTSDTQVNSELHGRTVLPPTSRPPQPEHTADEGAPASQAHRTPDDIASEAAKRFAPHPPPPPDETTSPATPAAATSPPPPRPDPPDDDPAPPLEGSEAADTSWKPTFGRTSSGPLIPNTKDWIEEGWGADCYSDENMDVLVALPYSPKMGEELVSLMFTNLKAMECANHGFNLHLALYDRPFNNSMNAKATKLSGRSVPLPPICTNTLLPVLLLLLPYRLKMD
jgi:hypothetical protein